MNLNYKASNIAKAEKAHDASFFTALSDLGGKPSVSLVMFLLAAGGATEDECDALVADKGLDGAISKVIEGLADAGFLGKGMTSEKVRKTMKEAEAKLMAPSDNSGAKNKA